MTRGPRTIAFASAMAFLLAAGAGFHFAVPALGYYLRKLPIHAELTLATSLPMQTDNWRCVGERQESAEMLEVLGTENYVTRVYRRVQDAGKPDAVHVEFHGAYYTGMIDTVPHVPERCLVGGGYSIAGTTRTLPIPIDLSRWSLAPIEDTSGERAYSRRSYATRTTIGPDGLERKVQVRPQIRLPRGIDKLSLRVTEFSEPKSGARLQAGYFFIANGGVAGTAEEVRLLAFDLRADYAYYMKVQFSGDFDTPEELAEHAASLLEELLPDLLLCAPDWYEVERGAYPPDNPRGAAAQRERSGSGN